MKNIVLIASVLFVCSACAAGKKIDIQKERSRLQLRFMSTCLSASNPAFDSLLRDDGSSVGAFELGSYSDDAVDFAIDSLGKLVGQSKSVSKYNRPLDLMRCWEYAHSDAFHKTLRSFDKYLP